MKKIIKFLSVTMAVVCALAFTISNKSEKMVLKPSETGYQAIDCKPSQPWANLGWQCTATTNGGCTVSSGPCHPYIVPPGGPTSDLNMFELDYDALRAHLISAWGWSEGAADSLIKELRYP